MSYSSSVADVTWPAAAPFPIVPPKTLSASDETIAVASGQAVTLTGDDDILLGSGYRLTAANDLALTLGGEGVSSAAIALFATHDAVTVAAGTNMRLKGSDDKLVADGAMNLVMRGNDDVLQGSSISVDLLGGSSLQLTGSNDSVTLAADDTLTLVRASGTTIVGEGYTLKGGPLSNVTLGGNAGEALIVVAAYSSSLNIEANSMVSVTGGGDAIVAQANSRLRLTGSDDTFTGVSSDVVAIGGDDDVFLGGGYAVRLADKLWASVGGNGVSGPAIAFSGSGDILSVMANSDVSIAGANDHFISGGHSTLLASGSSNVVKAGSEDQITLGGGSGNEVTVGVNDTVDDLGSSDTIGVYGNVGKLVINGFGADAAGLIDINSGGYTTTAAIEAALTSDGHGGTLLKLGVDGAIDFVGVAAAKLGASHFSID